MNRSHPPRAEISPLTERGLTLQHLALSPVSDLSWPCPESCGCRAETTWALGPLVSWTVIPQRQRQSGLCL